MNLTKSPNFGVDMKALFIILSFSAFSSDLHSQTKQVKEYYDQNFRRVREDKAVYYRMVTRNDSGYAVGLVHDYYISGALQWTGYLDQNDEPQGHAMWYYENGNKQSESDCYHGYNVGNYREWYQDGKLHSAGYYVHTLYGDERRGNWITYYENGNVELKEHFTKHSTGMEDVRDSICSLYYPNGKLLATGRFDDGFLSGIGKYYDTLGKTHLIFMGHRYGDLIGFIGELAGINDGTKNNYLPLDLGSMMQAQQGDNRYSALFRKYDAFECKEGINNIDDSYEGRHYEFTVKNGDIDGEFNTITKDSMMETGLYKNGLKEGLWKNTDKKGLFLSEQTYKHGKLDGISKIFAMGKEMREESYKNGARDGISMDMETDDYTGKPLYIYEMAFKNDSSVIDTSCKQWYIDTVTYKRTHVMMSIGLSADGTYFTRYYYPNGRLKEEAHGDLNMENGTYKNYYPNGAKMSEGILKNKQMSVQNAWDSLGKPELTNGNGVFSTSSGNLMDCSNCVTEDYYSNYVLYKTLRKDDKGRICSADYKAVDNTDSISTLYFPNGKKQQESRTLSPKKEGETCVWDTNGALVQKMYERDTAGVIYFPGDNGVFKREATWFPIYKNTTAYYPNGQKRYEQIEKKGRTISMRQWDEKGNITSGMDYTYDEFGNLLDKKQIAK